MKVMIAFVAAWIACSCLHAQDFNTLCQSADKACQEKKHAEAVKILSDYIARPDTPADKKKDAYFRIASFIHSADKSAYPAIRDAMESFLKTGPLNDGEKKRALDTIDGTFTRSQDWNGSLAVKKRILELTLPDRDRAEALSGIAKLLIHQIRNRDEGKTYFHACIVLLRKEADASEKPLDKAGKLANIARIYLNQTGERAHADKTFQEAADIYVKEAAALSGKDRARLLTSIAGIYADMRKADEADKVYKQAADEYQRILDDAKGLSEDEWLKAVEPQLAMNVLRNTEKGCRVAIEMADQIIGMKGELAKRARADAINQADWICRFGKSIDLPRSLSYFIEQQLAFTDSTAGKQSVKLRLAEIYFRTDHDLKKARTMFAEVAASADAEQKVREDAALWCEMLEDEH